MSLVSLQMFLRELEIDIEDETRTVKLDQRYEGDTGVVVWDAAIVLAKYLESNTDMVRDKEVVELGSGTGAVGLCAGVLGAKQVILTDREELVEFLSHNIELNTEVTRVSALALEWGNNANIETVMNMVTRVDLVLVSDCVFYEESLDDLVETMQLLSDKQTRILLTYEERDSQIKHDVMKLFFEKMKSHFTWKRIPHEEHHPDYQSPDIQIYTFTLNEL